MSCFDELIYAMCADGELPEIEDRMVRSHAGECLRCRQVLLALEQEKRVLVRAFQETAVPPSVPVRIPLPAKTVAAELILAVTGLAAVLRLGAGAMAGLEWPAGLEWLNPLAPAGQLNYVLTSIVYLIDEGGPMFTSLLNGLVWAAVVGMTLLVLSGVMRRVVRLGAGSIVAGVLVAVAVSSSAHAAEIRSSRAGPLTIASGETIDDTLIAFAESVIVDGTINGDLIAWGSRITVNGAVTGDVISGGRTVEIRGVVGGNVFGFGQNVDVFGSLRNLYGFGQNVRLGNDAEMGGNATVFGQTLTFDGPVMRDILAFGQTLEVRSNVGSDITFYGRDMALLAPARVDGNLTANVPSREAVVISQGAVVAGQTDIRVRAPRPSRYATFWFYFFQVVRVGAAFVTGLLLIWIVPGLNDPQLNNRVDLLKAGGIGFLAAVATPVAAVLIGLTLVGIPAAIILVILWLLGLYLGKIVIALFLGRALFPSANTSTALTLLAGLVIVIIAVNVPYVGGIVNLLLTLIGLGTILLFAYNRYRSGMSAMRPA
jgi:hypothetical protein